MALEYTADASMTVTRTAMIISVYRSVFDARFLSTPRTILSMLVSGVKSRRCNRSELCAPKDIRSMWC